jgi:hypothetical protein
LRNREVYSQLKDLLKWNKRRRWMEAGGWIAETIFSSIKRGYVWRIYIHQIDKISQNMIKEMMILKVSLYNVFRRIV